MKMRYPTSCRRRSAARRPRRFAFASESGAVGFTLIELLTVIAIIGILAAIIIPTVGKVRQSARQAQAASNLRQIDMALLIAADSNRDRFPPTDVGKLDTGDGVTLNNTGFGFFVLPYLGFKDSIAFNASRLMVDPLVPNNSHIAPPNLYAKGSTWSGNTRLMGSAYSARIDLSSIDWKPGNSGVPRSSLSRPSLTILAGSAVIDATAGWGCNNTFSSPSTIGSDSLDTIITPEKGNTSQEGGSMGGIAYRASGGNAAMFVMADGSVKVIPKNEVKVLHFAANL